MQLVLYFYELQQLTVAEAVSVCVMPIACWHNEFVTSVATVVIHVAKPHSVIYHLSDWVACDVSKILTASSSQTLSCVSEDLEDVEHMPRQYPVATVNREDLQIPSAGWLCCNPLTSFNICPKMHV